MVKRSKASNKNKKTDSDDKLISEIYLDYHDENIKKYGTKSLVLMQVGSFYECYATDSRGPDLYEMSSILNITKTVKDKSNTTIDYSNPYMLGFPMVAVEKYMPIIINNNYTVMVIDQVSPAPNPKREIVGIFSRCNYLDNIYNPESNYTVCLYIEEINQKNGKSLLCAGMSAVDLSTSKVFIHEAISLQTDNKLALDECNRFIASLSPKEIIVYTDSLMCITKEFIVNYLELDGKFYHYRTKPDPKYSKLSFQNEILEMSYKDTSSMISIIEHLDLEKLLYSTKALVMLIDFSADHEANIINNLHPPESFMNDKHIILGNNAQRQLNIIKSDTYESHGKIKSLLDIVNKASTPMGKRFIQNRLMSPLVNCKEIEYIYNTVDNFIHKKKWIAINEFLVNIKDIERLERRISLLNVQPYEMYYFIESMKNSYDLLKFISKDKKLKSIEGSNLHGKIKEMIKHCNKVFNYDVLKISNITKDIPVSFFKSGTDESIDQIEETKNEGHTCLEDIREVLDKMINTDNSKTQKVILKHNTSDGHYLYCTKIRGEYIEEYIEQNKLKIIDAGSFTTDVKKLEFKYLKNGCKIIIPMLKTYSEDIGSQTKKLSKCIIKVYVEFLRNFYSKFSSDIKKITNVVIMLDYYKTIADVSVRHHYTRPIVNNEEYGYIEAQELRHPIVEQIIDHEYKPHDISIGTNLKGMLVYGLNSAGKSVLMKAVGLSIILAQAGFYVPAKRFEYSPYYSIYTRITGNDNIFKGLSSFALEMVELNSILKRSFQKSLMLGDEVCRGTDHISGNAIVATTLIYLSDANASFIFATHLHDLPNLEEIKSRNNIKAFHLSVEYDNKSDALIYDRILKEGSGERIYGITVAKSIIHDSKFIDNAMSIKNRLLDKHDGLLANKSSNYNASKHVFECELCGKKKTKEITNLETHHINFQKDFDEDGINKTKLHIKKNAKYNLLVVCDKCHDKIHDGKINIEAIKMTSKGKKVVVKKNKK